MSREASTDHKLGIYSKGGMTGEKNPTRRPAGKDHGTHVHWPQPKDRELGSGDSSPMKVM